MSAWIPGMREGFFDALYQIAKRDERVVLVTADIGAFCHDDWRREYPDRYVNVGIAEQNLVGVAAGLALSGKIPFVYTIVPFVTMRCYEQVRVDLCCMNLPVTLVGIGAGSDYSTLGPTHHGTEDLALMRALPGMAVFVPSDRAAAAAYAEATYHHDGPAYLRLSRTGAPLVYADGLTAADLAPGAAVVREGTDLGIVATGRHVVTALEVAEKLGERSLSVRVIDLHRVDPLPSEILLEQIGDLERLVTVEEHFLTGGIGSAMAELIAEQGLNPRFKRIGLADGFCRHYGNWADVMAQSALDAPSIAETIRRWAER